MTAFTKVDSRVQHPDKVRDVSNLLCHFSLRNNRNGYAPFIAMVGIGTETAYHKGISIRREMHVIIEYFKLKGIPLSNIIGIDADKDVCSSWNKQGITVLNNNWNNMSTYKLVTNKIKILAHNQSRIAKVALYANTFGNSEDVSQYCNMIKYVKPHRFLGLHVTRRRDIRNSIICPEGYRPYDLGFLHNSRKHTISGLVGYNGIALHVIDRTKKRQVGRI